MKLKIILSSIVLLFLFSCKKKVSEKVDPELIGEWQGQLYEYHITLTIDKNGYASYKEDGGKWGINASGTAKVSKSKLKIGLTRSFGIIDYPHRIDTTTSYTIYTTFSQYKKANWKMELSVINSGNSYPFHRILYKVDY